MSSYEAWARKHDKAIVKAKALIESYGFKVIMLKEERTPSFLRVKFGKGKVDFKVKIIKTKFARSVWLCKDGSFVKEDFYLLWARKENKFFVASGTEVNREYTLEDSEYRKGEKYIVTPFEVFHPATVFLKKMKARFEAELQQRMTTWF